MILSGCKKGLLLTICFILSSCGSIQPNSSTSYENYLEAKKTLKHLSSIQETPTHLTYYEALARGIKFNLDYRIKLANDALQKSQLRLAEFAMFPALNATGSLYTRSNDLATFGITTTGELTDVLNSTPRTLRSARIAFNWNVLDFGLSYLKAKQQSDRFLIAKEEARKQLQRLVQDITSSYWDAYTAQRLMVETKRFEKELALVKRTLDIAMRDQSVPKENLMNYQQALLDGNRHVIQLQSKYEKALYDLKHLLSLPLDAPIRLAPLPRSLLRIQDLKYLNFRKLDAITLASRSELRGQNYQQRIARFGLHTALVQALPGLTLNQGWNYNSNKFLINNDWVDKSMDVAWNLLNLASVPTAMKSARAQMDYEKLKAMAITLTVLTETRYAYSHYQNLFEEYKVVLKQKQNSNALYQLMRHRKLASLASTQQVILAKIRAIAAKMDQELMLSSLSTAFAELYLSSGYDLLTVNINQNIPALTHSIRQQFEDKDPLDFNHFVDNTYDKLFSQKEICKKT